MHSHSSGDLMEFLAALHLYINFVRMFLKILEKKKNENRYK